MSENTKVYKIRRKSDHKFSTGGMEPDFTTRGKTWGGKGPFNAHLSIIEEHLRRLKIMCERYPEGMAGITHYYTNKYDRIDTIYDDCEVIEFSFEGETKIYPMAEWKSTMRNKKNG